ncbi:MAG: glycine cleavage system protein GcvH [bacterium]|nr:glycine cleavage system protein GcvH [bacterium]
MAQPQGLLYSKEHEWAKIEGDVATIGITGYAQESLGDIVFVELPRIGARIDQGGNVGVVESVKAVSDLFTPLGGEVVEVNGAIEEDPGLVNREPFGAGWMFKVKVADAAAQRDHLLDPEAYDQLIQQAEH